MMLKNLLLLTITRLIIKSDAQISESTPNTTQSTTSTQPSTTTTELAPIPDTGTASLLEGFILENHRDLGDNWELNLTSKWQSMRLGDLWLEADDHSIVYKRPALFLSPTFGPVVAEQMTLQERYYPRGRYWHDLHALETQCLCTRTHANIEPALTYESLSQRVVYRRKIGTHIRHLWHWDDALRFMPYRNPNNVLTPAMTAYRTIILYLFQRYSIVTADCTAGEGL